MMRNIVVGLQRLTLSNKSITGALGSLQCLQKKQNVQERYIHIPKMNTPQHFLDYNKKMYPIQELDEERRPAFVCHRKCNIRYTPKKMLYIAWFVRGMTIDEALKQLSFVAKKGAAIAKETLLEAQKLAVEEHNVEFKSNLWVAESFCTKGFVVKGKRRHSRGKVGEVRYTFCHYFVRLEEGKPPKDYYKLGHKTSDEALESYKESLRQRRIPQSL
ncbi:39S ribosomal protein L22, mitochondrial [Copidosoma floridanum]|uniref:39S ribosomal protein L22, mitochondrial n=1 Tax=Copidosoma floridanum TaxID=29053 RepID=UPI0006C98BBB|nr:39S ribosomal protein L22, mitochondrial [Copidosoma floridanum]